MSNELVEVNDDDRSIYEWLVRRVPTLAAYNQHGHVERMFARHRNAAGAERTAAIAAAVSSAPADVREALEALEPLAANGNFYRSEVPHFEQVKVPLEYLRRAASVFERLTGRKPLTPERAHLEADHASE